MEMTNARPCGELARGAGNAQVIKYQRMNTHHVSSQNVQS